MLSRAILPNWSTMVPFVDEYDAASGVGDGIKFMIWRRSAMVSLITVQVKMRNHNQLKRQRN